MIDKPIIVRRPGVLLRRPVFLGTRVQAELLFENLAEGYDIDEIIENFRSLDREDVEAAIMQAGKGADGGNGGGGRYVMTASVRYRSLDLDRHSLCSH